MTSMILPMYSWKLSPKHALNSNVLLVWFSPRSQVFYPDYAPNFTDFCVWSLPALNVSYVIGLASNVCHVFWSAIIVKLMSCQLLRFIRSWWVPVPRLPMPDCNRARPSRTIMADHLSNACRPGLKKHPWGLQFYIRNSLCEDHRETGMETCVCLACIILPWS